VSAGALDAGVRHSLDSLQRTEQRGNRLARALDRLGVTHRDVIGIICCERHGSEAVVAGRAAAKIGAAPVVLPADGPAWAVTDASRRLGLTVFLACAEGAELWRVAKCRGRLIADAPGAYWWQLIERCESPEPFFASRSGEV
jgi:acyl-coenzyme A synthetase/AMP-(fatty) acid ligase